MKIITLTVNPALDKSTAIDQVVPDKKLRCENPGFEPGGGGINVSRALAKLEVPSLALLTCGGPAGKALTGLLEDEGIPYRTLPTESWTRENLMVMEKASGQQFRFGMPGASISEEEQNTLIEELQALCPGSDYLVASGSLARNLPEDFYAEVARIANRHATRMILDTSGDALVRGVEEGVFLLKPNLRELAQLTGKESISAKDQEDLARELVREGKCRVLVVSLGPRGAMLATAGTVEYFTPPTVPVKSKIGAGDSMLAGMVAKLIEELPLEDVVRYGIAAGTAATLTPGTQLCRKEDTEQIFTWLKEQRQKEIQVE